MYIHGIQKLKFMEMIKSPILLLVYKQWVKLGMPTGKTYDDISFPIAFASDVYQIIPIDWDTANITTAKEYVFTIADGKVTLTGARIVANASVGYYKALIIGK